MQPSCSQRWLRDNSGVLMAFTTICCADNAPTTLHHKFCAYSVSYWRGPAEIIPCSTARNAAYDAECLSFTISRIKSRLRRRSSWSRTAQSARSPARWRSSTSSGDTSLPFAAATRSASSRAAKYRSAASRSFVKVVVVSANLCFRARVRVDDARPANFASCDGLSPVRASISSTSSSASCRASFMGEVCIFARAPSPCMNALDVSAFMHITSPYECNPHGTRGRTARRGGWPLHGECLPPRGHCGFDVHALACGENRPLD